jgi:hypothetical protein
MKFREKVQATLALPETIREVSILSMVAMLFAIVALGFAIATAVHR